MMTLRGQWLAGLDEQLEKELCSNDNNPSSRVQRKWPGDKRV